MALQAALHTGQLMGRCCHVTRLPQEFAICQACTEPFSWRKLQPAEHSDLRLERGKACLPFAWTCHSSSRPGFGSQRWLRALKHGAVSLAESRPQLLAWSGMQL